MIVPIDSIVPIVPIDSIDPIDPIDPIVPIDSIDPIERCTLYSYSLSTLPIPNLIISNLHHIGYQYFTFVLYEKFFRQV